MSKSDFHVPVEVRESAQKTVEQARDAFETFSRSTQTAINSVDPMLPAQMRNFNRKAFAYAEVNVNATFELAQKIVQANGIEEILKLQADFVKAQAEALQKQASDLAAAFRKTLPGKTDHFS